MTPPVTKREEGDPFAHIRAVADTRAVWESDPDGAAHVRAAWPALANVLDALAATGRGKP